MQGVRELINRRRRQIHLHSVLYYHLDASIITDAMFDMLCRNLVELHRDYPEIVSQGYRPDLFADWTGETGMHLPATPLMMANAKSILATRKARKR